MLRLVVLGDPVAHSRSPAIHTAALAATGLDGVYTARRVDGAGVRTAVEEIRDGTLDGANVTMPHKAVAAAAADRLDGQAGRADSVNTLVREDGQVVGYTTDVGGIRDAWSWAGLPVEAPVLLLGGGGAAAAALLALEGRDLRIATRRPGAGIALAQRLGVVADEVPWGAGVRDAVVVNATPIGMHGETLPDGVLEAACGLFEMAYGPEPTPAVARARRDGVPVAEGLDMLVAQAARSFTLWTGVVAPIEAMREAASPR
jgi:shikimate dehydrogenase